jgi:hypothetical protein
MTATRWLERLRDATPPPPETAVGAELLAAWQSIAAARKAIFDEPDPPTLLTSEHAALAAELAARESAWLAALGSARDRVVTSRLAIGKARRYQHGAGAADSSRR